MSAAQTIAIQKILAKKFTDQEAVEILEYVDKRKDKSIDRLWIAMIGGFTFISVFLGIGLAWLAAEIKTDVGRVEDKIDKILLQKR